MDLLCSSVNSCVDRVGSRVCLWWFWVCCSFDGRGTYVRLADGCCQSSVFVCDLLRCVVQEEKSPPAGMSFGTFVEALCGFGPWKKGCWGCKEPCVGIPDIVGVLGRIKSWTQDHLLFIIDHLLLDITSPLAALDNLPVILSSPWFCGSMRSYIIMLKLSVNNLLFLSTVFVFPTLLPTSQGYWYI